MQLGGFKQHPCTKKGVVLHLTPTPNLLPQVVGLGKSKVLPHFTLVAFKGYLVGTIVKQFTKCVNAVLEYRRGKPLFSGGSQ